MASTNKTANYELSQFLGSDKPAWLGDYNTDMSKIDAQMKLNADTASGADGKADSNATAIGTLANLTTEAKTSLVSAINEVDSNADTAQGTANNASTTANSAELKADTALSSIAKLNLVNFTDYTITGNNIDNNFKTLHVATNSDASLCKIYGEIRSTYQGSTEVTFTTGDTGLRPTSKITIQGTCLRQTSTVDGHSAVYYQSFDINTDGTISWKVSSASTVTGLRYMFMACLIFVKDFGDTPTPAE